MFGFSPLSAAPFAATGSSGVVLVCAVGAGASASSTALVAASTFNPAILDASTVADASSVALVLPVSVSSTASASSSSSAVAAFSSSAAERVTPTDSPSVAPSTFSAAVSVEQASATDRIVAYAVFIAAASGGAITADQVLSRLLWELIDDSQAPGWQNISTN